MKNIVVVGGSGGLGSALVSALLDRNYQVMVVGRKPPADHRVAEFFPVATASADWPAVFGAVERSTNAPIDAVIFVSGTAVYGKAAEVPAESARQTMELNFWSCTAAAQAAAQYWSGHHRPGKFLAVLSIAARIAVPFEAHYSASKAATARFLECLDLEYGGSNIRFLSAFPGTLKTPFRSSAVWHGLKPSRCEGGAEPVQTAQALIALLEGRRHAAVIGWRERATDLAERLWPGLYGRLVQRDRVRKLLESQAGASEAQESSQRVPQSGAAKLTLVENKQAPTAEAEQKRYSAGKR
jgi:short-subunit dehydrogenase